MGFFYLAYHSKMSSNLGHCQYLKLHTADLLLLASYIRYRRKILCKECGIKCGAIWEHIGNLGVYKITFENLVRNAGTMWNTIGNTKFWRNLIFSPWCVGHHIWPTLMAGAQTVGLCSRSQILTWGSEVGSNSWIAEPYTHGCCVPGLRGGIVSFNLLLTECRLNMSWVRMTSIQARIQCHTIQNKP